MREVFMRAVDDWSPKARFLSTGGLLAWVLVGSAALFEGSSTVGVAWLVLWVAQYIHCRYLACTRCYYYGRRCHMLGGDCAALLFARRPAGRRRLDDALIGAWWAIVTLFPLPFLACWRSWGMLVACLVASLGWQGLHHVLACRRCKNDHCPLNASSRST
jgi:hypothetical protein